MKCLLIAFLWHSLYPTGLSWGEFHLLYLKKLWWHSEKKCIMQQFKIAKIFGSSFLDFNPARGKKYAGREVQKKKERNRNNPLSLPPFALFSHLSLTDLKSTCGLRGRILLLLESTSLPGFSVERSDFHEHEQETSPWSCFQDLIINGCISIPLITSSFGDVIFSLTAANAHPVHTE